MSDHFNHRRNPKSPLPPYPPLGRLTSTTSHLDIYNYDTVQTVIHNLTSFEGRLRGGGSSIFGFLETGSFGPASPLPLPLPHSPAAVSVAHRLRDRDGRVLPAGLLAAPMDLWTLAEEQEFRRQLGKEVEEKRKREWEREREEEEKEKKKEQEEEEQKEGSKRKEEFERRKETAELLQRQLAAAAAAEQPEMGGYVLRHGAYDDQRPVPGCPECYEAWERKRMERVKKKAEEDEMERQKSELEEWRRGWEESQDEYGLRRFDFQRGTTIHRGY